MRSDPGLLGGAIVPVGSSANFHSRSVGSMPGGRPTKLTAELAAKICGQVGAGKTVKDALVAVNVDESTFYRWIRNGHERPGSIYGQFRQSIVQAKGAVARVHLATIHEAGQQRSRTITTVTKEVLQANGELALVEKTVKVVDRPPDVRAAIWMVDRCGRPSDPGGPVEDIPKDVMARSIAEQLRIIQGSDRHDQAASMLRPGDVEARRLLESG